MSQEYYVTISPLFSSPDKIKAYLNEHGFPDIKKIVPGKDNCQVYVGSEDAAKELHDKIDSTLINGSLITASAPVAVGVVTETRPSAPPPPAPYSRPEPPVERSYGYRQSDYPQRNYPQRDYESRSYTPREDRRKEYSRDGRSSKDLHSRTIQISGYKPPITRRIIWEDFHTYGYIKQIEVRENIALIQFETPDDAFNAIKQIESKDNIVRNTRIGVELISDRPLNIPSFYIPLIVEDEKNPDRDVKPQLK